MKKRNRAGQIKESVRENVAERDQWTCIFCAKGYRMKKIDFPNSGLQIMHYISKGWGGAGGLGTEKNLAVGCYQHHQMMDNGLYGKEMKEIFKEHLQEIYPDWNEADLIYKKEGTYAKD